MSTKPEELTTNYSSFPPMITKVIRILTFFMFILVVVLVFLISCSRI